MSRYSKMRSQIRRSYMSARHVDSIEAIVKKNIICTHHSIDRLIQRMVLTGISAKDANNKLTDMVAKSRLVSLKYGQELREYEGVAFVCKREYKEGEEKLIVITVLLTTTKQKMLMNGGMDRFASYAELAAMK